MKKMLVLPLLFIVIFSSRVMAVDVTDLSLEYSERYIQDDQFLASFECHGDDYAGAKINITNGDWWYSPSEFTETPLGENITQIAYNIDPGNLDGTGTYTFKATCFGNTSDTSEVNFDVYDYELKIVSPVSTIDVVQGDYLTTLFTFKKVIGSSKQDVSGAKFNVILSKSGQEFVLTNNKAPDYGSEGLEIKSLISYVPNENFYGPNDLIVEYSNKPSIKDTVSDVVNIQKAFEIYFEDLTPIQMSSGGSLDVPVYVNSPLIDSSEKLFDLSFNVNLDGSSETITGSEITCSQSGSGLFRCVLPVSVPDEAPGSYQLQITGRYKSYSDTISKEIYFTIPFSGALTYASGQIVYASIEMQNLDTGKWYKTSVNKGTGEYSLDLLPGRYKLKLSSPEIEKVEINGIDIKEDSEMITSNSPISIDSFTGGEGIAGINCVKLIVFQFALSFENAQIWIKYKDIDVTGSEEDMELYSCHDWNYGKRKCNGEWTSVPFDINTVTNIVHFNITEFSAFILGNKKSMSLEATMDKDTYNSREHITFTGNVMDNEGFPVENAKVSYSIKDMGLSGSTYTDDRGHFVAADLVAPEEEGTYIMEITVEKNPYKIFTTTYPVKIVKKVEFTLAVPEEVGVDLDKTTQTKLSIINTGQKDLSSVSVSVKGISTDWYSLVPMTINNLTVGSEKVVTMNIRIPSEYCKEKCQIYYFVDVTAKSDNGLEQTKSFTLRINENVTETISPGGGISLPSLPTGNIIENLSNPYVAVTVFILIAFVVLFLMKNRKNTPSYKRYEKKNFFGGPLRAPTFFKKGYSSPIKTAPYKSIAHKKKVPRESVVPTLYEVKKSTREWN